MPDQSIKGNLSLFHNDFKKQENHPNRTGSGEMPKALLKELIEVAKATPGDTIPIQCASWDRVSKGGVNYTYVSFEKKWVKQEPAQVVNDGGTASPTATPTSTSEDLSFE